MPPPKTIFVDTRKILASIREQAAEQAAEVVRKTTGLMFGDQYREQELPNAEWVPRDLQQLAGKALTESERKRHQEALRQMEADGLVALEARHVRLLPAGLAMLEGTSDAT